MLKKSNPAYAGMLDKNLIVVGKVEIAKDDLQKKTSEKKAEVAPENEKLTKTVETEVVEAVVEVKDAPKGGKRNS